MVLFQYLMENNSLLQFGSITTKDENSISETSPEIEWTGPENSWGETIKGQLVRRTGSTPK